MDNTKPSIVGPFIMGCVDEVNGQASQTKFFEISYVEAYVLAKYWLQKIVDVQLEFEIEGQTDSANIRIKPYAKKRIDDLIAAGLVTVGQMDALTTHAKEEMDEIRRQQVKPK